jgi:nucleotide-binding universal stress UspA family protein
MVKVLVPVDGSKNCLRAVQYLIGHAALYKDPIEIHLLNVQRPFPGTVRGVREEAEKFHHDEGIKALADARKLLDDAGLKYAYHINVGEAAELIAQFVKQHKLDQVVMCTRGMGAVANMLLGSVASKVLHLANVPVVLVK